MFYKRKNDGAIVPINPGPKGEKGEKGDKGEPGDSGVWWSGTLSEYNALPEKSPTILYVIIQ